MSNKLQEKISQVRDHLATRIIGQQDLIDSILMSLLTKGHLLVEGPPGVAKTKSIVELATALSFTYKRIQFTPDLLPVDITGSDIYNMQENKFVFQSGPIFNQIILADEINRAPAKVQSALLEAMAEYQVTVGGVTYPLAEPFLVLATQNPIEQQGTYSLPEAQLDRFLMNITVDYPNIENEKEILNLIRKENTTAKKKIKQEHLFTFNASELFTFHENIYNIHLSDALEDYILNIVRSTREPEKYDPELKDLLEFGVSSRASIAFDLCSRAYAFLNDRDYVIPEDIQNLAKRILRHRIISTFEAKADNIQNDDIVDLILKKIPSP